MSNNRRAALSVVSVAFVVTHLCGKHISAAVNQHATIKETVFSVWAALRLHNEDLTQLQLELSSGVGSWQNNGKKGITL
jgi:hypothetical protein